MTPDQTLILVAALLLAVTGVAFAAYERGYANGRRAQRYADDIADSAGRHPSRCEECG